MRYLATSLFILVGLINLFPSIGVLGAARLEGLYGVALAGDDLLLMMRHKARAFWADVIACVLLLGGYWISRAIRRPE